MLYLAPWPPCSRADCTSEGFLYSSDDSDRAISLRSLFIIPTCSRPYQIHVARPKSWRAQQQSACTDGDVPCTGLDSCLAHSSRAVHFGRASRASFCMQRSLMLIGALTNESNNGGTRKVQWRSQPRCNVLPAAHPVTQQAANHEPT